MRDLATKVDASSNLTASEANSFIDELENAVEAAGITLDAAAGPDNDLFMLARSILIHTIAGSTYQDNGAANTFVLAAVQATFEQPIAYEDGMTVRFKAAATNTGVCTINVEGLGAISFTKAGGGAYAAGEIVAGNNITATFFQGTNRFEEVANTTPEASGPAAPNQIAVYADSGSASQITLTIEPGFNQPPAFTDQMVIMFKANATNDGVGPHPVSVVGLGIKDLVEKDGTDPVAGRITADDWVLAVFREVRDEFEIAFAGGIPVPRTVIACVVDSSSGTAWNVSPADAGLYPPDYVDGMVLIIRSPGIVTGPLTVNFNGLGSKSVRRGQGGADLSIGEIRGNAGVIMAFDAGSDFFRIISNGTKRGRITNAQVVGGQTISPNGETRINFDTPERDGQGFYNGATQDYVVPSGRGIRAVNVSAFLNLTIPSGQFASSSISRIRGGGEVLLTADQAEQGQGNNNLSMTAMNIDVQDGDLLVVDTATTTGGSPTTVDGGSFAVTVVEFEGEEV